MQLWHLFEYAELSEVVRQNDTLFIYLPNKVHVNNINDDVENLLKVRFMCESDKKYPKAALHIYTENKSVMKRNSVVLNDLHGELYRKEANDKIPDNCKIPVKINSS